MSFGVGLGLIHSGTTAQMTQLTSGLVQRGINVCPVFYGLMTAEINPSYEGSW